MKKQALTVALNGIKILIQGKGGEKVDVKTNKTVAIVLIVLAVMAVAAALATGIYYTVKHNRFSGYVYESGTGKPLTTRIRAKRRGATIKTGSDTARLRRR